MHREYTQSGRGVRISNRDEPGTPAIATIENKAGVRMRVCSIGASIVGVETPDREGVFADIALGLDSAAGYRENPAYFGSLVGRCANRIADGRFVLDGAEFQLALNDSPKEKRQNHLHGGPMGFSRQGWSIEPIESPDGVGVRCRLVAPDGDQGYPGELHATVDYVLGDDDTLRIDMSAEADRATLCNLAQHTYWNLGGHGSGPVLGHLLEVNADRFLPVTSTQIPTGEIVPVQGTPFDFRRPKPLGLDATKTGLHPSGYDHTLVVVGEPGRVRPFARVEDPASGRTMTLASDQPGLQLYTANFLDGSITGKQGVAYQRHGGLCLETQQHPNSVNTPGWPAPVLRPGERYRHRMVLAFGVCTKV